VGLDPLLVVGQLFSFSTFDVVGWVFCPVKLSVSWMTYIVLVETLNHAIVVSMYQQILMDQIGSKELTEDHTTPQTVCCTYLVR